MRHAYTEDQLVEQPAIGLFAEQMAPPYPHPRPSSQWEKGARPAEMRVRSLVVLVSRLREALERVSASRTGSPVLPKGQLDRYLTDT